MSKNLPFLSILSTLLLSVSMASAADDCAAIMSSFRFRPECAKVINEFDSSSLYKQASEVQPHLDEGKCVRLLKREFFRDQDDETKRCIASYILNSQVERRMPQYSAYDMNCQPDTAS